MNAVLQLVVVTFLAYCVQHSQTQLSCEDANISYVFVLDSSSSVDTNPDDPDNPGEWEQEKTFVKNFYKFIKDQDTNNKFQVGVLNYGSTVRVEAQCNSAETQNEAQFNALIDGLPKINGGTAIHDALAESITVVDACRRDNEETILLFLTDGTENILFDETRKAEIRADVQASGVVFIAAVEPDIDVNALVQITGDADLVETTPTFEALGALQADFFIPVLQSRVCTAFLLQWSSWGACSAVCHAEGAANPTQTRTRACSVAGQCTQITDPRSETQDCNVNVPCQGTLSQWSSWGSCSLECQLQDGSPGTRDRTRTCTGGSRGGNCNGAELTESQECNVEVACQGTVSEWGQWGACSAVCAEDPSNLPTRDRSRTCDGSSFGGNCNGATLTDSEICNNIACQGTLTQWSEWGACSADCQANVNVPPTQSRTRECRDSTLGGNCNGAALTEDQNCNVGVPCSGTYGEWGQWGACSAICQLGNLPPTRERNRECQGGTFGGGCTGPASEIEDCNVEVPCEGRLTDWGQWGACSDVCISDAANPPTRTRTRQCVETSFGGNCNDAPLEETGACNRVGCTGTVGQWAQWGACAATCQADVNNAPTRTRTRECLGATLGENCNDAPLSETGTCNVEVACPGAVSQWGQWGGCSATCQLGLSAPTRTRTRTCVGATFGGNCNGDPLNEIGDCNVEVPCPGVLTQWGNWGACSETCVSDPGNLPTRTRTRQCIDTSFGGNCGGQSLTNTENCNSNIGCRGQWSQWGPYGSCSESCQSNVDSAPTQVRIRTCEGATLGAGCENPDQNSETRECNVAEPCPGVLTQWGSWGSCSAICQIGNTPPRQTRSRVCQFGTFGGNCYNARLIDFQDCNVEVPCDGQLTEWSLWSSCSETCHSVVSAAPTQTRIRICYDNSFGGSCFGASLTDERECNVAVGCLGVWANWTPWSSCSETCQSNRNAAPSQGRTRVCEGATFGVGCEGIGSETQNCNVGVPCPGIIGQWGPWGSCSQTCHLKINNPIRTRTRVCNFATLGADCEGAPLIEYGGCNQEVPCPGDLTLWSEWGICSATCHAANTQAPERFRARTCEKFSFGGNCNLATLLESQTCNFQVSCPAQWSNWGVYSVCSETCQSNINVPPFQTRTRVCEGGSFGASCQGESVESRTCNVEVPCQGQLTPWSSYTPCSETCQIGLTAPSQSRIRTCILNTFSGNCNNAVLVESRSCNVERRCPGVLTEWSQWTDCPETCQSGVTPSIVTRFRQCTDTSFGGNCNAAFLTETRECNRHVTCPGIITQWGNWGSCSATCHLVDSPTRMRNRECITATFGGDCEGQDLTETENCNFQVQCPGDLSNWGDFSTCSETCQSDSNKAPSQSRIRACTHTSFGGNCFGVPLSETVNCNENVICPVIGTWQAWGEWGDCSQTCGQGSQQRARTCSEPFPFNAGDDCDGEGPFQTRVCEIVPCPAACPLDKRCNCSLAPAFSTAAPDLAYFNLQMSQINDVVNLMSYWTEEIQEQLCEACNVPRLQMSLQTVGGHIAQVEAMQGILQDVKRQLREIINCNSNVFLTNDMWKLYDYLYSRCSMINGIHTELMACQMRFDTAIQSCQKYGWFHDFVSQVYRKW